MGIHVLVYDISADLFKMDMKIYLSLFIIWLLLALFHMVGIYVASKISGKYFDSKYKQIGKSVPLVFYVLGSAKCARTQVYLFFILIGSPPFLKYYSKKSKERYYSNIGAINCRKLARKKDWVLAFLCEMPLLLFGVLFVVLCIYHTHHLNH